MENFKQYQHRRIITTDGLIANGDFIMPDIVVRITDGFLNDAMDDKGNIYPAIETLDGNHIEHWKNGVLHCVTAPAVVDNIDNYEEWWFEGHKIEPKGA